MFDPKCVSRALLCICLRRVRACVRVDVCVRVHARVCAHRCDVHVRAMQEHGCQRLVAFCSLFIPMVRGELAAACAHVPPEGECPSACADELTALQVGLSLG